MFEDIGVEYKSLLNFLGKAKSQILSYFLGNKWHPPRDGTSLSLTFFSSFIFLIICCWIKAVHNENTKVQVFISIIYSTNEHTNFVEEFQTQFKLMTFLNTRFLPPVWSKSSVVNRCICTVLDESFWEDSFLKIIQS